MACGCVHIYVCPVILISSIDYKLYIYELRFLHIFAQFNVNNVYCSFNLTIFTHYFGYVVIKLYFVFLECFPTATFKDNDSISSVSKLTIELCYRHWA